jgi:hypothetical protein
VPPVFNPSPPLPCPAPYDNYLSRSHQIHVGPVVDKVIADKKAAELVALREFEREVAMQAAHADPANWMHTGIWFASQQFWTCCQRATQGDKFAKGCTRRPRDENAHAPPSH